jgi:hypothetical protein
MYYCSSVWQEKRLQISHHCWDITFDSCMHLTGTMAGTMRRYSSYRDMEMTGGCVVCSGHGAMKENYYLDDGTYSASQIVIIMVKRYLEGLGKDIYKSLLADLKEPVESNEFRLKLKVRTATPPKGVSPLHEDFCCLMQPCWPSAHTPPKSFIQLLVCSIVCAALLGRPVDGKHQ